MTEKVIDLPQYRAELMIAEAALLTQESERGLVAILADWFSPKVTGLADPTQIL